MSDSLDLCADTLLPEKTPSFGLAESRYAVLDDSGVFSTAMSDGNIRHGALTLDDTAGCTCAQLIEAMGLGASHQRYGCTEFALQEWISSL